MNKENKHKNTTFQTQALFSMLDVCVGLQGSVGVYIISLCTKDMQTYNHAHYKEFLINLTCLWTEE